MTDEKIVEGLERGSEIVSLNQTFISRPLTFPFSNPFLRIFPLRHIVHVKRY